MTEVTDTSTNLNQPSIIPSWLSSKHLAGMLRGIEKEGLRMQSDGFLAQTPHPESLGSKLTHPYITTDYSESLLELITSPKSTVAETLNMLRELHVLVYQSLEEGELMWPLSMPCMLSSDDNDIPLAEYGNSNVGRLKTLYRSGLGIRYGRRMQTIAGLHYNLSFGDDLFSAWRDSLPTEEQAGSLTEFKNIKYLALIRNFKRMSSSVLYLTGASPSVCPCFLTGREHDLTPMNKTTYYKPKATSLRMSKLGYTNSVQDQLDIRYNNLPEYVAGLRKAINTPCSGFSELGLDDEQVVILKKSLKAKTLDQILEQDLKLSDEHINLIKRTLENKNLDFILKNDFKFEDEQIKALKNDIEIKNVNDIVLKFFTIIGNIAICAAIGTLITFTYFCTPPNLVGFRFYFFWQPSRDFHTQDCLQK